MTETEKTANGNGAAVESGTSDLEKSVIKQVKKLEQESILEICF